jgi:hypothetical protein
MFLLLEKLVVVFNYYRRNRRLPFCILVDGLVGGEGTRIMSGSSLL